MINFLACLYFIYGFMFFYTYIKGYSLLRYLMKRKNINVVITVELIFIILCSVIVFTSQPLNWIVGLIMFTHIAGIFWLISNPEGYYSMLSRDSLETDSLELSSAMIVIGYGVFIYSSKIFLG